MTDRDKVVRELHDGLGDCDLCPETPDGIRCDLIHQLERAYDAGHDILRTERDQWRGDAIGWMKCHQEVTKDFLLMREECTRLRAALEVIADENEYDTDGYAMTSASYARATLDKDNNK